MIPLFELLEWAEGLPCVCKAGPECGAPAKHPRLADWPRVTSTDPQTITGWFNRYPLAGVGIVTGRGSQLVVIDIDPRNGGDETLHDLETEHGPLPETVEVLTGGGGRHIYFRAPEKKVPSTPGGLGPGIDIKADGGLVVAPPSMHQSGIGYEWEVAHHPEDTPLAALPQWVQRLLRSKGQHKARATTRRGIDPASVLSGVVKGERNDKLFRYAARLRGLNLGFKEAKVLLYEAASNCNPPLPHAEVDKLLSSAFSYPAPVGDDDAETPPGRTISIRAVADWFKDPPQPVEPIVTDLILPGDQVVVGGARGAAKTWLAMGSALQLARGDGLILGRFPVARPVKVLYCQGELPDDHSTFARWDHLTAEGSIPETLLETYSRIRIRIVRQRHQTGPPDDRVSTERTTAEIDEAFIAEVSEMRPDVVVLDPWAEFYTGHEIDNTQIEAAVSELTTLTDELGIAWLIIHHFSQARQGADPEDWWRGATRLADWASVRITLQPAYTERQARDQGMTRMEARQYANVRLLLRRQGTPADFGARFDPSTGLWVAWNSPTLTDQRRSGLTVDDVLQRLWAAGGRWASTNEARVALGVSHAKAKQVLAEAERAGRIASGKGPRGATTWSLKAAT